MKILGLILKLIFSLPHTLKLKLSGGKPVQVRGNTLDIDNQVLAVNSAKGVQLNSLKPARARKTFQQMSAMLKGTLPADIDIQTLSIPVEDTHIAARLYRDKHLEQQSPLLMYFHGGGNVIGDLDSYEVLCAELAKQLHLRVLAVDYRLAPEYKFPTPPKDAFAAYCWALANAADLNIHEKQIVIAGDSAGGYLCSACSLQCLEQQVPLPKAQILIYPMCDISTQRESYTLFGNGYVLTKNLMDYFIAHFIGDEQDKLNPLASPLLADEALLGQMPETLITLAGFDPLYDEGKAYYEKLKALGVSIHLLEHRDLTHGFITMTGALKRGAEARDEIISGIGKFL